MPKGEGLGEFEQIVLLAVLRLGPESYGMRIRREIQERTGRDVAIGAVYATLERLESKALVKSHAAEPTEDRGGRAKRFFDLTAEGAEALNKARRELSAMLEGIAFPLRGAIE